MARRRFSRRSYKRRKGGNMLLDWGRKHKILSKTAKMFGFPHVAETLARNGSGKFKFIKFI
jgi:hypothetical protein